MDLVASFLLKLGLAAVAALPPPKALGLKVSKGGLKLRILAVLDGLLPQGIGESPKPSQWPGLGWIFDKGQVLIHDGTLELRPRVYGLLCKISGSAFTSWIVNLNCENDSCTQLESL